MTSIKGATSVTWTLSVTWPTSSFKSAVTCACVATIMPLRSNFLNPGASQSTVYVPGTTSLKIVLAAAAGSRGALLGGAFVNERDFGDRNHTAVRIGHQPSYHSVI